MIHDLSVWLRNVYNPADIYRFRSHTKKMMKFYKILIKPHLTKKMKNFAKKIIFQLCKILSFSFNFVGKILIFYSFPV